MANDKLNLNDALKIAIDAGLNVAIDYIRRENHAKKDRRLHNVKLLLKNYKNLRTHCEESMFSSERTKENIADIMSNCDDFSNSEELYIEAIRKSKSRTLLILDHVDKMMELFRYISESSKKTEISRQFRAINLMYIDDEELSVEDIADSLGINTRTVYKDVESASKTLATLIFGIDSIIF